MRKIIFVSIYTTRTSICSEIFTFSLTIFAYILLIPTIALGTITLGIMNQIIRAFSEVTSSFQYLVRSWSTIIDLISVFKRLQAFEAVHGKALPKLDLEYIKTDVAWTNSTPYNGWFNNYRKPIISRVSQSPLCSTKNT